MSANDLEHIALLYDSIRGIRRKVEKGKDKDLAADFDRHLKGVMMKLSTKLNSVSQENETEAERLRVHAILDTKRELLDICFIKAVEYLRITDPGAS